MKVRSARRIIIALTGALMTVPGAARAQDIVGRVAVEAVASAKITSATVNDPFMIFDAVSTIRVGRGWDAVVRPWARRMPGGDWGAEMYQLQLRYTSSTRVPFRVDAGIISSPVGLATLELRPDRNPTIDVPFYYYMPLPSFDARADRVTLMSGGYPLGAIVSASGARWDVRGGVTDATPGRPSNVFSRSRSVAPQVVGGAGLTPVAGLRTGVGIAHGRYRAASPTGTGGSVAAADAAPFSAEAEYATGFADGGYGAASSTGAGGPGPAADATVFNVEGEYAIGYTRIAGEWIVSRFETTVSPAVARGFNLQAVQTLTPRWFVAARAVRVSSPVLAGPAPGRRTGASTEGTLGYRLSPEITLRGGYQGSRSMYRPGWDHALAVSAVWSQRWW